MQVPLLCQRQPTVIEAHVRTSADVQEPRSRRQLEIDLKDLRARRHSLRVARIDHHWPATRAAESWTRQGLAAPRHFARELRRLGVAQPLRESHLDAQA